jgi:hypothetical protein
LDFKIRRPVASVQLSANQGQQYFSYVVLQANLVLQVVGSCNENNTIYQKHNGTEV